VYHV